MRTGALSLGTLILLAGCAAPEPEIVDRTQEVKKEVVVACPVDVPEVEGPDFAAEDSNVLFAATYAEGRIIALRKANTHLREAIAACQENAERSTSPE